MQIGIKYKELIKSCDETILFLHNKRMDTREDLYQKFHLKKGDVRWSFLGLKFRQKTEETKDEFSHRYLRARYSLEGPRVDYNAVSRHLRTLYDAEQRTKNLKDRVLQIGDNNDTIYLSEDEMKLLIRNE